MKAEIISVGTELLLGQIVDTNATWIARRLAETGLSVYFKTTVGDNWGRIAFAVKESLGRADVVIMTGGLGPTDDDLTKEVVADVLGLELVMHQESADHMRRIFQVFGRTMSENNLKQAMVPESCIVVPNPHGTAPGIIVEKVVKGEGIEGNSVERGTVARGIKSVICLPGVPREMKAMMDETVIPYLQEVMRRTGDIAVIRSRVLRIFGVGESAVQEVIGDIFRDSENPTVAPLASPGEVRLRITARAKDEASALEMIEAREGEVRSRLRDTIGDVIFGVDDARLEDVIGRILTDAGLSLAVAESCTGGLISHRITNVPGSSAYFHSGLVCYSNNSKEKFLGVDPELIGAEGAVSRGVAIAMAVGARKKTGADLAIATTGIAGPGGGSPQKPAGLVYFALASAKTILSLKSTFPGSREDIKERTAQRALGLLWRYLIRTARKGREP